MELKRHISLLISVPFYFIIIATCLGGEIAWANSSSVVEEVYAVSNVSEGQLPSDLNLYKDNFGIRSTEIDLPTSPLTTLCTSSSKPYIDENIIAWNDADNPCFIRIGENKTYTVSDSIGNVDIKTSNGILVYKNKVKHLCITNISNKPRFNLEPEESHKINNMVVGLYAIKGDKIVFSDGDNNKIYLISDKDTTDNLKPIITRGSRVSRLQLTVHDGETLMLWRRGQNYLIAI
ncbi:MAG TPA: hypothetical protein VFD02_04325 [Syntrophomonadaceae bacterium]|nr:hypothetical protein [Syntrophomonadaceae bacterium]